MSAAQAWDRGDLDKLGCQLPGCTQRHHHGPLFLHTKCHPKQPSIVRYHHGGRLEIDCHKCERLNVYIQLASYDQKDLDKTVLECGNPKCTEPPENHSLKLRNNCHKNAGIWVVYSAGQLFLRCGRCKSEIATLDVKPATAEA